MQQKFARQYIFRVVFLRWKGYVDDRCVNVIRHELGQWAAFE